MTDVCLIKEQNLMPEKFKINHYKFGEVEMEDFVHTEAPFFHFQILRPESEEKREKALAYFNEHKKIFIAFISAPEILLYLGCTENIYIRSKVVDFEEEQLRTILNEVSWWFQEQKMIKVRTEKHIIRRIMPSILKKS